MNLFPHRPCAVSSVLLLLLVAGKATSDEVIEEITVTAELRERPLSEVTSSVTVFNEAEIDALAVEHFEELVRVVPNLNWSGDGHRARYFQIRGVGELEQYEGAPNPSVGFLIDDIDFSGIGTIASLFDIERIEVLRGPQGTRYGANALAGLVYVQSRTPGPDQPAFIEAGVGSDGAYSAGVAFGGAATDEAKLLYRVSAHHHSSNGFRDNVYLDRDDTNGREETVIRSRLRFLPSPGLEANLALIYAAIDNGYDAFSLDNSFTMRSDRPGEDAQQSVGASLRLDWEATSAMTLTSLTAFADSMIDFGFDADWGNPASWAPYTYDFTSSSDRSRQTLSQELRLEADGGGAFAWLVGLYYLRLEDGLDSVNRGEYVDPFAGFSLSVDDRLSSAYEADSVAAFTEAEWRLGSDTRLTAGIRVERREAGYADSNGLVADPGETMAGGEVALSHDFSPSTSAYVAVSRGYKAGGFNLGFVPPGRREFGDEVLWNVEAGVRANWLDGALGVDAAIFYNRRDDQQVRTSFQLDPGDPASFVFFTDNAATGETFGLEAEARWLLDERWSLYANLGLLDATFDEFRTPQVDLSGRRQAHAPSYTIATGASWQHPAGWFARIDVSAKDAFYFDVSHDQRSEAYELVHLRLGYEADDWRVEWWARNLFDRKYAVRGFFFGNEPPDFPNTLYTRPGDPRQVGLRVRWSF